MKNLRGVFLFWAVAILVWAFLIAVAHTQLGIMMGILLLAGAMMLAMVFSEPTDAAIFVMILVIGLPIIGTLYGWFAAKREFFLIGGVLLISGVGLCSVFAISFRTFAEAVG